MAHDLGVAYENRAVPGDEIDIGSWSWRVDASNVATSYVALGPCPACHATCEGWAEDVTNPIERGKNGGGDPGPVREDAIEVAVSCRCGSSHGRDGAKGCGRRWTIVGPKQTRP